MYYNVFGEKVSRAKNRLMQTALKNRKELIAANLCSRRELMKLGLLTSAGMLVPKSGLSARVGSPLPVMQSGPPPITPFVDPMPIMPIKLPVPFLFPTPTANPNTAINPLNGLPFEGRTLPHQLFNRFFPNSTLYAITQFANLTQMSSSLPLQMLWTFDGISPGPTYVTQYGKPVLVRNINLLPPYSQNGGFGRPTVTTHLHNGHTPSESDGFFHDFYPIDANGNEVLSGGQGQYYDQQYPNVLAGFNSTNPPNGDINESLSTLWYHDHHVGFTAQNTYKGLVGQYLIFNQFDTGNETTGFRLPSFPLFDIPMIFRDAVFDDTGTLTFDMFNIDGILGNTFLVNGKVQPVLNVLPRRYRFRWTNVGPSRFYSFYLTNLKNLSADNMFWQIANDGNLLPHPVQVDNVTIGVAERADVIIDFTGLSGQTFYIENRLQQLLGRGPAFPPVILPAGTGNLVLQINVVGPPVPDESANPATQNISYYTLPSIIPPVVTRHFAWDRLNGMWSVNGRFVNPAETRFTVTQNTAENWIMTNLSGDWEHPLHIHLEEHQILTRNGAPPPNFEVSRKDVMRIHQNETVRLFFRFRDWTGRYPVHCHNVVHEDNAMMMRWEIQPEGDTNRNP